VPPYVALGSVLSLKDGNLFLDPAQGLHYVTVEPLDIASCLKRPVLLLDLIDDVPPLLGELGLSAAHLRGVVHELVLFGQGLPQKYLSLLACTLSLNSWNLASLSSQCS
jgi:hypothetical protein